MILEARGQHATTVVVGGIGGGGIPEDRWETTVIGGEIVPVLEGVEGRPKNMKLRGGEEGH